MRLSKEIEYLLESILVIQVECVKIKCVRFYSFGELFYVLDKRKYKI